MDLMVTIYKSNKCKYQLKRNDLYLAIRLFKKKYNKKFEEFDLIRYYIDKEILIRECDYILSDYEISKKFIRKWKMSKISF